LFEKRKERTSQHPSSRWTQGDVTAQISSDSMLRWTDLVNRSSVGQRSRPKVRRGDWMYGSSCEDWCSQLLNWPGVKTLAKAGGFTGKTCHVHCFRIRWNSSVNLARSRTESTGCV
jgi:hypothetical protein